MANRIETVAVIGAGFMGSQIASRSAVFGYKVHICDLNSDALERAKGLTKFYIEGHFQAINGDASEAIKRTAFFDNIEDAVKDADLVIEAVTENIEAKKKVFSEVDEKAPPHAIIATNSSSLPVSMVEGATKRKDKVVNIHFAAPIPERNYTEIMRGSVTSDETFRAAEDWSRSIDCLPLLVKNECMGFVVNRVWRAAKREALASWANDYADITDIDRGWMKLTGMYAGPFGLMDAIGLDVIYNIEMAYWDQSGDPNDRPPDALKAMIDRGELGMKSGKGFYTWPEPEFTRPDFLDPKKKV